MDSHPKCAAGQEARLVAPRPGCRGDPGGPDCRAVEHTRLPNGTAFWQANALETLFLYNEIFERKLYTQHGITIGNGAVVVDVGANVGLFSLFACAQAKDLTILAVEPIPTTCEILRRNALELDLPVRVLECGLGDREETAEFGYYPNVTMMSGRAADAARDLASARDFFTQGGKAPLPMGTALMLGRAFELQHVTVKVHRLSTVLRQQHIKHVDLLKVDVERAELGVLMGLDAEHWPAIQQAVVEVHDEEGRLDAVLQLLAQHGLHTVMERDHAIGGTNCTVYARR
jgi:FkbM family methyltransferase